MAYLRPVGSLDSADGGLEGKSDAKVHGSGGKVLADSELMKVEEMVVDWPIMASNQLRKKSGAKKRDYTTVRQQALVDNIPTSKTHAEAAIKAGYPAKNARQSAYQALKSMRGRVPDLMDQLGLTEEHLIDKHLRRHLNAKRTVFFQKDGKVKDSRKTEALEIQSKALDMAARLQPEN